MSKNPAKTPSWAPILFISGKGGVGKSFVSALIARNLARQGKKVLLVEMSELGGLSGAVYGRPDFEIRPTGFGFDVAHWSGEECLREYIRYRLKVPFAAKLVSDNKWFQALVATAPGLRELSFLGKVTSQSRQHGPPLNYDHYVIDAVSSGHLRSLLAAPEGLAGVVSVGPLHQQAKGIARVLRDPEQTQFAVISLLEEYSVNEAGELSQYLLANGYKNTQIVMNKTFPPDIEESVWGPVDFRENILDLKKYQDRLARSLSGGGLLVSAVPHFMKELRDVLPGEQYVEPLFT